MSESLPIPPELQHLIEKRDAEADRREEQRRDSSPLPADADPPTGEADRREKADRRRRRRRKADS